MANRFSVDTVFRGIDQMSGVYGPMTAKAKAFEKSLKGSTATASDLVGKPLGVLQKVGAVTVASGIAAGAVMTDLIGTGAEFEKTMIAAGAKFSPAIRQGTAEFEKLRITAEQVGAATEFNAQQAAMGLKDLASAGFNAEQAIAALPGVVDLATASEVDLSAASEMATKSLGAFNLKTDDAILLGKNLSRVNDVMSRTADATSASMEGLFQAILEGAPVAVTAGQSVETFMALAGQLANSGIEASVAGTTLKNVFLTLSAPSKEAAAGLAALNINTTDAKGNMLDAVAILGEIEKATNKMGTARKAEALEGIFGKIPIAGVTALLGGGINKVAALRLELEKAGGSTARMAAIMRDSTKNDIDGFTSAVDGMKIAVFNVVKGPFRSAIQSLTEWTAGNTAFLASGFGEKIKEWTPLVVGFADGVAVSFQKVKPVVRAVGDAFDFAFGQKAAGAQAQAYFFGRRLTDLVFVLLALMVLTKAASAATWAFQVASKAVAAAVWLYEAALVATRWAVFWYGVWSKAGAASTIAMAGASVIATGQMVLQRASAFAAAAGMRVLAVASWAASSPILAVAAAIAALLVAADQLMSLVNENGGLEGMAGMLGIGTEGWGFAGIDEAMNKQARARAAAGKNKATTGATAEMSPAQLLSALQGTELMRQFQAPTGGDVTKGFGAVDAIYGQMPNMTGLPAGIPGMPPMSMPPAESGGQQATPQVALKDESTAALSQNLSRDISSALKGTIEIKIKDKGGNAEVNSSTGSGVNVTESGSF